MGIDSLQDAQASIQHPEIRNFAFFAFFGGY